MNEKVKQALENVKNIKVGTMVLNDLFGEDLKIFETALNDYEEHEKELIAEQHRLFDLAKEQEKELKELKEALNVREDSNINLNEINIELRNTRDSLQKHLTEKTLELHNLTQELEELREFAKYFTTCSIVHDNDMWVGKRYFERDVCGDKKFDLVKRVVEKYGN